MRHENVPGDPDPRLSEPGRPVPREARDDDPATGPAGVAPSSQGLGAIFGDAERTPHPGPVRPVDPADQAAIDRVEEDYRMGATDEGERYLTPREDNPESGATTDEYPDSSPT